MAFKTVGAPAGGNSESTVDYEAINRYRVEAAGLQDRETLGGRVAAVIDLGVQKQPDAETVFVGSEADEEAIMAEYPDTYFKDGIDQDTKKEVRLKCWPQKPVQCVCLAIDFDDIIVDMAQAHGEPSNPLPLRLYTGNQFFVQGQGMVVARPTPLRVVNLDKTRKTKRWSLAQNNMLHKMAVAAKLIKADESFLPDRIDELLGKAFQFDAQVYFKQSGQKEYFTEYLRFASALGRGQTVPELSTTPQLVQFDEENPDRAVIELRQHVVNTMKGAENFKGSVIEKQINTLRKKKEVVEDDGDTDPDREEEREESKPTPKVAGRKPAAKKEPAPVGDDDTPW